MMVSQRRVEGRLFSHVSAAVSPPSGCCALMGFGLPTIGLYLRPLFLLPITTPSVFSLVRQKNCVTPLFTNPAPVYDGQAFAHGRIINSDVGFWQKQVD